MSRQLNPETERKRAWLNRYRESLNEQNHIMEQLKEARSRSTSICVSLNPAKSAPTGSHSDRAADSIERILDLQQKLDTEVSRGVELALEIGAAIKNIRDPDQQLILEIFYLSIKPRTMAQVAYYMDITQRHARRVIAAAFDALDVPEAAPEGAKCVK